MESRFSFSLPLDGVDILWVSLFLSPLSIVGVEEVSYRHFHGHTTRRLSGLRGYTLHQ